MTKATPRILIVGAGSGGISVAARLARLRYARSITILDPVEEHFYQPLWTLAGAGIVAKEGSKRAQKELIPKGVAWVKEAACGFRPGDNAVVTESGTTLHYNVLIVANGLEVNFAAIPGVVGNLGKGGLCSIYQYDQVDKTAAMIRSFKGGTAVFTMPPVPIKCAGAPQKIMYLADDVWRASGARRDTMIKFATAGATIFGIKEFAGPLMEVVKRKGIEPLYQHRLVEVKAEEKVALFEVIEPTPTGSQTKVRSIAYDLLHVVPPMRAPKSIRESILASAEAGQVGWLAVDKHSLQHKTFPNIFGLGDVTGIPNSKTGAAIRKQAPVVVENVQRFLVGEPVKGAYDGYSSCPLVTGIGKVILAEFGYDGNLMPSFPLDPTKERRIYWHLKKDLLPRMYWHGMLKGLM